MTVDDLLGSRVYGLYDNGKIRYVGRTFEFLRREAYHAADELFGKLEFRVIERSNDLESLRSLEQYHMGANGRIAKIDATGKQGKYLNPYQGFFASRMQ